LSPSISPSVISSVSISPSESPSISSSLSPSISPSISPSGAANYKKLIYETWIEIFNEQQIISNKINNIHTSINNKLDAVLNGGTKSGAAAMLHWEYFNKQDLDGDSLIYGIDFYISQDIPAILVSLPKSGIPLTWQEFKESHPGLF